MTAKGRKEVMRVVFTGEHANADIYQELFFETAFGPLGPQGRSLMENTPFGGFSAGLHRPNQLAAMAESCFWRIGCHICRLEFDGLLNRQRFAAKRPG